MRIVIKVLLPLCLLANSVGATAQDDIALYNFSVLLPLPPKDPQDLPGLSGKDLGCSQNFLSKEIFSKLPPLLLLRLSEDDNYSSLRLVSLRLDPVDQEFRLVFQPLRKGENGLTAAGVMAEDAALHLFYRASEGQVMKEASTLQKLFPSIPKNLLGVHPGLKTASHATSTLKKLLCRINALELYKVTFMTVNAGRILWNFGGFHIEDIKGERVLGSAVDIANVDSSAIQRIVRGPRRLGANVTPLPVQGDNMNELYTLAERVFFPENAPRIRQQVDVIENPLLNSPKTVDCVSCHATESVRRIGEVQHEVQKSSQAYEVPATYALDKSVPLMRLMDPINFRAFGYYDFDAVVMNRVLLESVHFQKNFKAFP